jgi:aryl-alcohol dehydrogenase
VIVGAPAFGTEVGVDVNHMLPGRTVTGVTLGDSETRSLIPTLVDLVTAGRFPIDRMVRHYAFEDIQQAANDVHTGTTIKPVLRF